MPTADPEVAHQFEDAGQQRYAATAGMWLFLATEALFFGGLFLGYTVYRIMYPHAFAAASGHTLVTFGAINTAVLILSSFVAACAVRAAERQQRYAAAGLLFATAALGVIFLGLKGIEYATETAPKSYTTDSTRSEVEKPAICSGSPCWKTRSGAGRNSRALGTRRLWRIVSGSVASVIRRAAVSRSIPSPMS